MTQLEGNGGQRLLKLFGAIGAATPLYFTLGTVASASPISVRLDGETVDTPSEGIIVAEHLMSHKRQWRLSGSGSYQEYEIKASLSVNDRVICAIGNDAQLVYILDKAVI